MEMTKYIFSILRSQLNIMWSWGFNSPKALENGLMFKVQGFIFKGWIKVEYNQGKDLFDITLLSSKMEIKKEIEGIFFDELVNVIDSNVEKVRDYENRVKQEYSLL
ncbi:hypothetical protein D0T84_19115 [Dysgonomonas sp. 521]|uniref:hypothetical protein n=1 Tax=Dysgonomonas sp. 521 TaxID=2302932 RepID=UPI0013D4B363|nr:hypothetical protein [Dysgonomonas sp. 521]NDV97001.1 hypothetical protein [Dysgonomonas sp. 521]